MIQSVRVRLALWHTGFLAVLLLAFAAAAYGYLARSSLRQADGRLREAAAAFNAQLRAESGDEAGGVPVVREVAQAFRMGSTRILVFDGSLRLLSASPVDINRPHADPGRVARTLAGVQSRLPIMVALPGEHGGYRVYATRTAGTPEAFVIAAVESLHERRELLEGTRTTFGLVIPLALLLSVLGGYLLARRSLAPVMVMSERAAQIGAANLHERLPVPNPHDELGQLATVFNGLLGRLGGAIEQQRRFMADAAHELRTPVAILRGETDVALARGDRAATQYRDSLAVVREEGRRLTRVVDDLFLLARADAGEHPTRLDDFYLNDLVEECVRTVRSLAASHEIDLGVTTDGDAPFRGDEARLHRLVLNLLDNAIKYSSTGARVRVDLRGENGLYRLAVRDTGTPIATELRDRIFERFFRSESARATGESGAGLGLAIARWIAEAHGGRVELVSPRRETGNEFVVWLPIPGSIDEIAGPVVSTASSTSAPA